MGNIIKWLKGSGPLIGMLMVQLIATGLQMLSKMVLSEGIFVYTLLTYRCLIAALCMAPFAFFLEKDSITKLNFTVIFWVLINSLAGCTMAIGLFYFGLRDTTATYATNFLNLIPIVTFILSLLLRMAKLNLNTRRGKVRVIGALLSVAGALIIILYKGKILHMESPHIHPHHEAAKIVHAAKKNWTRGTLLLFFSVISYAIWFIVQAKLLKAFPFKYSATMLTCLGGAIQAVVIGVCVDRKGSSWALGWNLQLAAIVYSGVLASAVGFYLISWAVAIKGPTYPAIFNPLSVIFVAILEALLLGEDLTVGSVIGMAVIIVGVYAFLWGAGGDRQRDILLPKATIGGIEGGGEGQRDGGSMLQFTAIVVPIVEADKKHSVH